MNSDAEPPRAGEEKGVRAPAEKPVTAAAPPGAAADPYAGLSNYELNKRLSAMNNAECDQQQRARLIRALEGNPDPPDPLKDLTALARRLRAKISESPGGDEAALAADIAGLRAIYADLLHNVGGRSLDERSTLTLALRAQKQALTVFVSLKKLQQLETKQNPPGKK